MTQDFFIFKTSFAQERLWFFDQFAPGNPFYNIHVALPLPVTVDSAILGRALNAIVARHESLRTTFVVKAEPVQAVAAALRLELPVVELNRSSGADVDRLIAEVSREESQRPFDLTRGPLLRTCLVRVEGEAAVLLLTIHHIVSDGWSMDLISRELRVLYDAFAAGEPSPLPELPIQYADFALWQREWLQGDVLERQLRYWRERLATAPRVLELPADRPRPPVQTFAGAYQMADIPRHLVEGLRHIAREQGATLFMALASLFSVLLSRYSGQDDIVIGTPIANRHRAEVQDLIGFFVNTLLLRIDLGGAPGFRALLTRVRAAALDAYQHQDLPFEKLVAELAPERHLSHTPLFQVMFVHQTSLEDRPVAAGPHPSSGSAGVVERGTAKFDLTLFTGETEDGGLSAVVEYNVDLFDDDRITRLLGHLQQLLEGIVSEPDRPVEILPLLTGAERETLMQWSGTTTSYPRAATVHDLLAATAARHATSPAVVCGSDILGYGELLSRSGALAHRLRELGASRGKRVAVLLERSSDLIVALTAVLAAGAAYVPLDPLYPVARLQFMLDDADVAMVITASTMAGRIPAQLSRPLVVLDDEEERRRIAALPASLPASGAVAEDLAYIIYTSGSTGTPKGVAVPHRGIVRLVLGTDYVSLSPSDAILQFAPVSFDASTFEIWGGLLNGARLVLAPPRPLSTGELGQLVESAGITTLWLTASLFQEVVDGGLDCYRCVRQWLAGGDVLSPAHVARVLSELPDCRLINGYGPTENTTFTCCHRVTTSDRQGSVPIGRPIANTHVRVLDRHLQAVPVGVPGELFVGGDGLADGYWHQGDLTAARFISDPEASGERLYRTGDVVRWRSDGVLDFVGRRDHQLKVRGFRVELGEVEAALLLHPQVRATAVIARGTGSGRHLVAHVVPVSPDELPVGEVRGHLAALLPEYMMPAAFVLRDALPMNPTGKVDREALAAETRETVTTDAAFAAPTSAIEQTIALIWESVLEREQVGVDDSFFELGGHSLLMVRVQRLLAEAIKAPLTLVELFQFPTIRGLAAHLGQRAAQPSVLERAESRAARQRAAMHRRGAARGVGRVEPR